MMSRALSKRLERLEARVTPPSASPSQSAVPLLASWLAAWGRRTRAQREPGRDDRTGDGNQRPRASGRVPAPRGLYVATDIRG
jgi:hypothetical protein